MSDMEDGITAEGAVIIGHVAEAWRLLLQLPDEQLETVADHLQGCYDWSEVEADATACWRASLPAGTTSITTCSPSRAG
jgi:hypothetical protein